MIDKIKRFIKGRMVKDRIKARRKFLPETQSRKAGSKNKMGDFDTDKFYDPKAKASKRGLLGKLGLGGGGASAGYAVGSADDPAMKERVENTKKVTRGTKKRAGKLKVPALERAASESGARERPIKRLVKRYEADAADAKKAQGSADEKYAKEEVSKDHDLRQKEAQKENRASQQTGDNVQKQRDWLAGKAPSDWERKLIGGLNSGELRAVKRRTKKAMEGKPEHTKLLEKINSGSQLDANDSNAYNRLMANQHKSDSGTETKRKKSLSQNKLEKQIAEITGQNVEKEGMSKNAARSAARTTVAAANRRNKPLPSIKTVTPKLNVPSTASAKEKVNVREGLPEGGAVRINAGKRVGDLGFDPNQMKRNMAKFLDEDGTVKNVKSRAKGSAKEEKHFAGQGDARKVIATAKRNVASPKKKASISAKKNARWTSIEIKKQEREAKAAKRKLARENKKKTDKAGEASKGKLDKGAAAARKFLIKARKDGRDPDDPTIPLSSMIRTINLERRKDRRNVMIGAGVGGAIGADQARRYVRDVRIRHKQLRPGTNELRENRKPVFDRANDPKFRDWHRGYTDPVDVKKHTANRIGYKDGKVVPGSKVESVVEGKRKKVGLFSKKAPAGFRRHVGSRALARILTPLAIGGGIAYGRNKLKNNERRKKKV
jgi:hypothetical protein